MCILNSESVTAWAAVALVFVGGTQAALFLWQLVLLRRNVRDASASAEAAREANRISWSAQRPWIRLTTHLSALRGGPLIYDQDGWRVVLTYVINNVGKTPARRTNFSARVIPFLLSHQPTPGGRFVPATDVAAELRKFARGSSNMSVASPSVFGTLLFPGEERPGAVFQVYCNDATFAEGLASPSYSGQLVVLACVSYQSTIDDSWHQTADAFAFFLNPNPEQPTASTRIELTGGRFDLAGRSYGFQYHPTADSYAT